MTKDVISLSISVLLLFRHYISHKITFGAPSSGGVLCSACGAFIFFMEANNMNPDQSDLGSYCSVTCKAWSTHRDHVFIGGGVCIVTLLVYDG